MDELAREENVHFVINSGDNYCNYSDGKGKGKGESWTSTYLK